MLKPLAPEWKALFSWACAVVLIMGFPLYFLSICNDWGCWKDQLLRSILRIDIKGVEEGM